jgi:hypothetical protein
MLNRGDYDDDEVISDDHGFENYATLLSDGYKPYSTWYEMMAKKLKYDKRKMSQEIECLDGKTMVTIRDKENGEIKQISLMNLNKLLHQEVIIIYCKHCKNFKIFLADYWYGYAICQKCYNFMEKIL